MANRVMLHLLGYNCNLHTGIGDQLKTLNVHEIWNVLLFRAAPNFGRPGVKCKNHQLLMYN